MSAVKYRHMLAWDRMIGYGEDWSARNQRFAKEDNAPLDVVYWNWKEGNEGERTWRRFGDVHSEDTKRKIAALLEDIE